MSMNFNFNNSLGSFFGGNSGGLSSILSDYSSIKNGSYRRLMKAYYAEANSNSVKGTGNSKKTGNGKSVAEQIIDDKIKRSMQVESAESKAYTSVKSATDSLVKSVDKLAVQGDNSLYGQKLITTTDENGLETTRFDYDRDAIYNSVNDFVKNYNNLLKTSAGVDSSSIANRVVSMQKDTKTYEQALNQIGITINADSTLSINKDNFMKADMKKVQNLFNDTNYTNTLKASADMIRYNANYEQLRLSTYTADGTFSGTNTSGNSFSSTL